MTVVGQPTVTYGYDVAGKLTSVSTTITGLPKTFSIGYDDGGRRTSLSYPNGVAATYGYDTGNRLRTITHGVGASVLESLLYEYDANGSRTKMTRQNMTLPVRGDNATPTCGTTDYTFNVRGQLTGINGFNADCSSLTAAFKYDALGRRTEKSINGRTIKYVYDGLDIVQEIEGGTVTVNYVRTLNIDEPLARVQADGTVRYYMQDALGSVIGLTDATGVVKTTYAYDPFGKVTMTGEASDNPFQFAGRENDNTGLYYYRARYYSPALQRFISEDPIGLAGGDVNFYAYVGNSPTRYNDPSGLIFGTAAAHILRFLGLASESTPVAGLITDTIAGGALSMAGIEELPCGIEQKIGIPYRLIQGWGGIAGINLGRVIAATSPSAGTLLPVILAGAGGAIIGQTINDIVKDITGESISDYMAEGLYIMRQRHGF